MAEPTPIGVPEKLTAGNTWRWSQTIPSYAPTEGTGTWTLSLLFAGKNVLAWDAIYATANGGGWDITIPATATAGLGAGGYQWTAILTGGGSYSGERVTPLAGRTTVIADPSTVEAGTAQNFAEKQLAAVEAVLAGRWTDDLQAYTIGGRSVTLIPVSELWEIRGRLRAEVWRARNPGKAAPGMSVAFVGWR